MDPYATLASLLCPLATLVTFGYLITCAIWPFGPCRRCHGTGKRRAPYGKAFRLCHRCDGTGRRIRIGRHVWNEIRREYRNGNHR
ncbi:hypothetical protein [Micromonospora sp. LOL_021]|uniref:hypothetical protein n=1 Tax=Micromonospora sp. LOL_021 TaxID=3345417 RepID=UPI003A866E22